MGDGGWPAAVEGQGDELRLARPPTRKTIDPNETRIDSLTPSQVVSLSGWSVKVTQLVAMLFIPLSSQWSVTSAQSLLKLAHHCG